MDKHRKERLEKRRAALQIELERKEMRGRVSSQIAFLENSGYAYGLYYESETLNWLYNNVSVRKKDGYHGLHEDFQIDVHDADAPETISIHDTGLLADALPAEFSSNLNEETRLIICYLGGDPELEIPVAAFFSDPDVFFSGFETWVITSDKNWIIEYLLEQQVIRCIKLNVKSPVLVKNIVVQGNR